MKVKRKYCKPEQFILDEVDETLLAGSYIPQAGGGHENPGQDDTTFGSRSITPNDSTFVDDEDVEPEIWTGYIKYKGFE